MAFLVEEVRLGIHRLGVLGGTFNPIHKGHMHIARSVQKLFSLSEVLFVVSAAPPHKPQDSLIELTHRYAMVSLATAGEPSFVPSLIELEPQASPYSVDTMHKIAERSDCNVEDLYFIAGGDSLRDLKSWHKSEKLLASYNFIFVLRPGVHVENYTKFLPEKVWGRVCDCTGCTRARVQEKIKAGRFGENPASGNNFNDSVPETVYRYIKKLKLYGVPR
ncbi:MAG: nicotinate (nicotinamide) nucleotide adenylyltransferase [Acidobacteriota bacterium]